MNNVETAVRTLQALQRQHQKELKNISRALQALGQKTRRVLSAAARRKIGQAQRVRWAEWKKHQKKAPQKVTQKKEPVAA